MAELVAPLLALSRAAEGSDVPRCQAALDDLRGAVGAAVQDPDAWADDVVAALVAVWREWGELIGGFEAALAAVPPLHALLGLWRCEALPPAAALEPLLARDEPLAAALAAVAGAGAADPLALPTLCAALGGFPQRLVRGPGAPDWAYPRAHFARVARLALAAPDVAVFAAVADKLCAVGQARALVGAWAARPPADSAPRAAALAPVTLSRVLELVARRSPAALAALVPPSPSLAGHARFVLVAALPRLGLPVGEYLQACGSDVALEAATRLARVWGDAGFVAATEEARQEAVTALLEQLVCGLNAESMQGGLLTSLLEGVRHHLGSAVPLVSSHGKRVARAFSEVMDPANPLDFGPDESSGSSGSSAEAPAPAKRRRSRRRARETGLVELDPLELLGFGSDGDDDDDESGPDQEDQGPQEDEWDSDDSLQPYDLDDDESDLGAAAPLYVRDCIADLRAKEEEHDRREAALAAVPGLARARPDELPGTCVELASAVLHLSNVRGADDFDAQWGAALRALCVAVPDRVAPYLAQQFGHANHVVGTRFAVLRVMVAAARELAKYDGEHDTPALLQTEPPKETLSADGRTRRWGFRRSPAPREVRNDFLPVAGAFFHPLLRAAHDEGGRLLGVLQREPPLLGTLLSALGCFVECARHGFALRPLAATLVDVAWTQRAHADAAVRRGVLFALSRVAIVVPRAELLGAGEMGESMALVAVWLRAVADKDPDPDCREMAGALGRVVG